MKANGTALYLFLSLCQIVPSCYVLIDKDVYGSIALSLAIGAFASFIPLIGQFFAAVGLEFMTGVPAMIFLVPLLAILLICHVTGGIKGAGSMLNKKEKQ